MKMRKILKENLVKLKEFRDNIFLDNVKELEKVLDSISNELPENYKIKFNALTIYEYYEESENDFDLPF